jgi:cardiolipin synthase
LQRAGSGKIDGAPMASMALEAMLAGSTGVSFSNGNTVEILEDEDVLRGLARDIRRARSSVTFQVYYIEKGRVLDEFAQLLRERAEAGVRVHLLLDAFGTKRLSRRAVQRMVGPLVKVARLRPKGLRHPVRYLHRAHCRSCVVDGTIGYTGGFGLADKWDPTPGEGPAWRELAVRVTGPAALQMQGRFTELWAEARGGEVLKGSTLFPAEAVADHGTVAAGLLVSNATQQVSAAMRLLDVLCSTAESRLWIYSGYFAPSPRQRDLLEAAARRGVDVRILTSNELTDLQLVRFSGRGNYSRLLDAGVRIWEFQPRMLHAKGFLLDHALMGIGTLNVDPVAGELNDENALVTVDEELTRALAEVFEKDLGQAREITLATLQDQPRWRRWVERAAAPLVRLP